jgi:hypothetical protein
MAVSLFGGFFWAGGMPTEVMNNIDSDWDVRPKQDESAGGHMVWGHSHSPEWGVLNTWGMRKPATFKWLKKNGWEAYVVLHPSLVSLNGRAECGLDLSELRSAIKAIT